MFRLITVTEDNYRSILKKVQKSTDNWKMAIWHNVYSGDLKHEEKKHRRSPIAFRKELIRDKEVNKMQLYAQFIHATTHVSRSDWENNINSINAQLYADTKDLIHLSLDECSATSISVGDKIRFLPFGVFELYTDNSFVHFSNDPISLYKDTYVPNWLGGRIDLNKEISTRTKEQDRVYYNDYDDLGLDGEY